MTSQRTRDRLVQRLLDKGIRDASVLEVVGKVPRHLFVDEALASRAYEDTALPIGYGQTISQPYIVARMTEAIVAQGLPAKVLEVGTGSGYQTAILGELVPRVYSVERILALCRRARERIRRLGMNDVRIKHSDGCCGWPEHGPYDAIVVTAAPEVVPEALLQQLAVNGRMVIPLGSGDGSQRLALISRRSAGFERRDLETVAFVPLRRGAVT